MRKAAAAIGVVAFLIALLLLLAGPLARLLIVRSEPLSADAMIMLSGSALQPERVGRAAALYRQGRAPYIIVTDDGTRGPWSSLHQSRPMMVERAQEALVLAGVAQDRIVQLPGVVHSTFDEAIALKRYLGRHRLQTVLIVTSAYHSRRALWVFRHVLEDSGTSIGIDPVLPGEQSPLPERWWLTRRGWRDVGGEYPKFAYYLLRY